jgi:pimeloyl-ACP methyl ester carboxylesterase
MDRADGFRTEYWPMKLSPPTRLALVALLAILVVVAYFVRTRGEAIPVTAPPIPARARSFTLGTLHFQACELPQRHSGAITAAFCAPFSVPENRADPAARTIALRLALIRSQAIAADRDLVVFLAGGPGQSAIETWPQIAAAFAPLLRHHHVLLLDQRGTGESNALRCPRSQDDAEPVAVRDDLDPAALRAQAERCLAAVRAHADPRFYTTSDAVADLEALRQALGAPQFDLIGVSYGTRLAQQYAMRHPEGVRSLVLDGVVPNPVALGAEFAINLEDALKIQFSRCVQTPACARAFGDPYADLARLRASIRAQPIDLTLRDPVTFQSIHQRLDEAVIVGLVRMFAYTPETAALLPLSIHEALQGHYAPLLGQARILHGDLSDLADNGMQLSVVCSEDADRLAPRPQDAGLLLGTALLDGLRAACEIWPHGARPDDFHAPFVTDRPVLILEGELDPVTPPRYGEAVLRALPNARLIVAKGQGHGVLGRGCLPKLVERFVAQLAPKALDVGCVDALGPIPAFIDFNGAAP